MTVNGIGKKRSLWIRLKPLWPLYLLLLPGVAYIVIFHYYPMYGAQIAFRNYKIAKGIWGSEWVGLQYFNKFVNDYQFKRLLTNTLRLSVYSMVASFLIRLILALSLNALRSNRYRRVVQTICYLPHFVSTVVIVGLIIRFFNPTIGIISRLIQSVGGTNRDLMGVANAVPHIYVWSGIWQNAGYSTILFLATLSSVNPELHEAAIIDGATRYKRILHIDLPTLIPTIVICLILDCGNILSVGHEKVLLMQNTANLSTMQVISTYVYDQGLAASRPNYSYASAIGLFNSAISFLLIIIVNKISKSLKQNSIW